MAKNGRIRYSGGWGRQAVRKGARGLKASAERGRADWVSPSDIAAMQRHPFFARAKRQAMDGIVRTYSGNRLINRLVNDRGRLLFGFMVLHLHAYPDETGTGLTTARISRLCEEMDICSRGRAKALLALLRWAGHLAPLPGGGDRRQRPLVPTASMLKLQAERWRSQFGAVAILSSDAKEAMARLEDTEFVHRLAIPMGLGFRDGFRLLDPASALQPIAECAGGFPLLVTIAHAALMAARGPADEPPPVTLPISELAARFHVSRAHVLLVLRKAEELNLLRLGTSSRTAITCLPPLTAALDEFFATSFVFTIVCVRHALHGADVDKPDFSAVG